MCWHERFILDGCGHDVWGRRIRTCNAKRQATPGHQEETCSLAVAHGLHTRRVAGVCARCTRRKETLKAKVEVLHKGLSATREACPRLKTKGVEEELCSSNDSRISSVADSGAARVSKEAISGDGMRWDACETLGEAGSGRAAVESESFGGMVGWKVSKELSATEVQRLGQRTSSPPKLRASRLPLPATKGGR